MLLPIKDSCRTIKPQKISYLVSLRKESSQNRKCISQNATNKKIILHLLTYIARPLCTPIDMKFLLNIEKYVCKLLVKFQLNSTLKLKITLYSIKLDNRHNNARI